MLFTYLLHKLLCGMSKPVILYYLEGSTCFCGIRQYSSLLTLLWIFSSFFFLLWLFFNWRKIALCCCVDFCCTTMQINQNYAYITSLFSASLVAQTVKNLPAMQKTWVWSLSQEDLLEKELPTHSSILAQRIPWTEEPGGLQSMGLKRAGHWALSTWSLSAHV